MRDFHVSVRKLTDENLMREACESTFLGKSNASLLALYKAEHSPVRTQIFWITISNLDLFVSTHLIRHHVGSTPFQLTCRDDRKGGNPQVPERCSEIKSNLQQVLESGKVDEKLILTTIEEVDWLAENSDRHTPVTLSLLVNAQSLIDMSKLRLCIQAATETTIVFKAIRAEIAKVDPDLASMMIRKCVYRGGICGEQRCCGFNSTSAFKSELKEYLSNFSTKQKGLIKIDDNEGN